MYRRQLILGTAATFGFAASGLAQTKGNSGILIRPMSMEQFYSEVALLPWTEVGNPTSKAQAYVFGSPWCEYTLRLVRLARSGNLNARLRIVLVDVARDNQWPGVLSAIRYRRVESLLACLERRPIPVLDANDSEMEFTRVVTSNITSAISYWYSVINKNTNASPMFLFSFKDEPLSPVMLIGLQMLEAILQRAGPIFPSGAENSLPRAIDGQRVQISGTTKPKTPMTLRFWPSKSAPALLQLPVGQQCAHSVEIENADGRWIGVNLFRSAHGPLYGEIQGG